MNKIQIAYIIAALMCLPTILPSQAIMIIRCNSGADNLAVDAKQLKSFTDIVCDPDAEMPCPDGYLCQFNYLFEEYFCVPDCSNLGCLDCDQFDFEVPLTLGWNDYDEICDCVSDIIDIEPSVREQNGLTRNVQDCMCPPGTVEIDHPYLYEMDEDGEPILDENGDPIPLKTCGYPPCYDGDVDVTIERDCEGNSPAIVTVTIGNVLPAGSYVTIEDLQNCLVVGADFTALVSDLIGDQSVAAGPSDVNGNVVLPISLVDPAAGASIDIISANAIPDYEIVIPSCPTITDPCTCASPFNALTGLYQDELTITNLSPNQDVILDVNNSGFFDINGVIISLGIIGQADVNGNFTFTFYRGEGQVADIIINGDSFISDEPCPQQSSCEGAPIPTMGEWGLICLALIFLIFGIQSIRESEKLAYEH